MDLNTSISIIIQDLNRACEIIDDLKKYPGVPLFQVELAKSKCRSAADVISLLPGLGQDVIPTEASTASLDKDIHLHKNDESGIAATQTTGTNAASSVSETFQPEKSVMTEGDTRSVHKTEPAADQIITHTEPFSGVTVAETAETKKVVHSSSGSGILADQFTNLSKSFNEELGSMKQEEDIAGKLRSKHLDDLSDAIGVNDRFVFIREIFNGSYDTYAKAISELNSAGNMSDARQVLSYYTGTRAENEAVRQLMELVKRKFQING